MTGRLTIHVVSKRQYELVVLPQLIERRDIINKITRKLPEYCIIYELVQRVLELFHINLYHKSNMLD